MNSRLEENVLIWKQGPMCKLESWEYRFLWKMEVIRVPAGRPSRTTSDVRTTGWEPLVYGI